MDELKLFERIRRGDSDAFDAVFRQWYPQLVRFAESMLQERAVAEEIAQDVMLAVWNRRNQLKIEDSPGGYLMRATRNRTLNELRHRRVQQKSEPYLAAPEAVAASAEADLADQQLQAALRRAMNTLPDRCREVFELSRVQGLRYAEIAQAMDISVKTVETQMGKALRILREQMAPWITRD
jgi:RNA polymerase sigma-70 factor, ECF subfamily